MALSSGKKEIRPKSTLLEQALKRVVTLPRKRQDAIAVQILDTLEEKSDPASARFQALIENKYTLGLTAEESSELDRLETVFRKSDETFYRPILERLA